MPDLATLMLAEVDAADEILKSAVDDGGRPMTEDETKTFNDHLGKAEGIKKSIEAKEALESKRAFLKTETPGAVSQDAADILPSTPAAADAAGHVYTKEEIDPSCGFSSLGEFARAVHKAVAPGRVPVMDARLVKIRELSDAGILDPQSAATDPHVETGSEEGEGWMVPPTYKAQVWNAINEGEDIFNYVTPEPTERNEVQQPTDETTPWGSAGIQAYWGQEAAQFTHSKLDTKQVTVRLNKLHAFTSASDEVLEDAPRLNNRLSVKAPQAILYKASDAYVNGNGVGRPLGWMQANCLVSVTRSAANVVAATDVFTMFSRLMGVNGFWIVHKSVLPQFGVMTIGNQPIYTPPREGIKEAPGGFLLGMPVKYSEHCQGLGTTGDIQLVNSIGYAGYRKQAGIKFQSSIHLYFDYDKTAFRWTFRIGGAPYLSAAIASDNGSLSYSHFIVLT